MSTSSSVISPPMCSFLYFTMPISILLFLFLPLTLCHFSFFSRESKQTEKRTKNLIKYKGEVQDWHKCFMKPKTKITTPKVPAPLKWVPALYWSAIPQTCRPQRDRVSMLFPVKYTLAVARVSILSDRLYCNMTIVAIYISFTRKLFLSEVSDTCNSWITRKCEHFRLHTL